METRLDEHFLNIGRIVSNFQTLEFYIKVHIWILLDSELATAQIITANLSFKNLCTMLQGIFKERIEDPELVSSIDDLLKRASKSEEIRNLAVHSSLLISTDNKDPLVTRYKVTSLRKKGLRTRIETLSSDAMLKDAAYIGNVANEFLLLLTKYYQLGLVKETNSKNFDSQTS